MHDIMHKDITIGAKVVSALGTSVSSEGAQTLARRRRFGGFGCRGAADGGRVVRLRGCHWRDRRRGRPWERTGASVTCRFRRRFIIQRYPSNSKKNEDKSYHAKSTTDSHGIVRSDREQMVIAPCEVRRADDHESAHGTVGRDVTRLGEAPWAEEALGAHFRMADAETGWGEGGQTGGEAHHHEVGGRVGGRAPGSGGGGVCAPLGRRGDEFEEEVLEMAFIHGHPELA